MSAFGESGSGSASVSCSEQPSFEEPSLLEMLLWSARDSLASDKVGSIAAGSIFCAGWLSSAEVVHPYKRRLWPAAHLTQELAKGRNHGSCTIVSSKIRPKQ
jgi:hypothetical protein